MTGKLNNGEDFISRLKKIVESNFQNEQFGVDELIREMGMSRSNIHRTLKKFTKQSVSHYIRIVRLEKAMQLLNETDESASEIAFRVGFGSPAYFTHCFHEHYGFPPGEVRKRAMNQAGDKTGHQPPGPGQQYPLSLKEHQGKGMIRKKGILFYVVAVLSGLLLLILLAYMIYVAFSGYREKLAEEKKSIIVLPFKNFTDNPNYQYFADGITEDILNNLYHIKSIRVVSRTSSDYFRESNRPVKEIARLMKVRYILEGSVRSQENKTRISVQLIDAKNDNHIWSENYDRELTDFLNIQDDIAFQVARNLNAVLSEGEIREIEKNKTQNPKAYDNYLRARFLLHKANSTSRADFEKSGVLNCIPYYEKAIEADSSFSAAYAGLANAWFNLSAWGFLPAYKGFPKARTYSMKALELDPECAEAHAVLGAHYIWGGGRNIPEGSKELKKAVELNPHFATARQWYAQCLMITGPIEEARQQVNRALELEPYFWVVQTLSAWIYYFEKKYGKAVEGCVIARDLNPDFMDNKWLFVLNYAKLGEGEKMLNELQSIIKKYTTDTTYLEEIEAAYSKNGIAGIFAWLIVVNNSKPLPVEGMDGHPFYSAWWNAILGNKDEAVYWLEQSLEYPRLLGHYSNLITTNPDFDILRDDPRFLQVIDKKGLTPYHQGAAKP